MVWKKIMKQKSSLYRNLNQTGEVTMIKIIAILSNLVLIISLNPAFADATFEPRYHPELNVPRLSGEIKIDGNLQDGGWQNAASIEKFCENSPGDQVKPPVDTRAYITYDDTRIYVAFVCLDDREQIRASYCERDRMGGDDNVGFFIDTYGNASYAYFFNVNPYGIQADALWSKNGGEDSSYDLIWESMGIVTDSGYQVEMAIPFSSLRFPDTDRQTWKAEFWRNHQYDTRRQYSWSAYDRNESCFPCNWGTLQGIEAVKPGRGIEILPSLIGYQSGQLTEYANPSSDWKNENIDGSFSLGMKYPVTPSITAEVTMNPDFSQVESDATQIDVNQTFALFYPEKRPFFQEGSDMYSGWFNLIYTRSINDPQVAAKLTGRMAGTKIAYIAARDEHTPVILPFEESSAFLLAGKSFSNIFKASQTVGEFSQVGFALTDRRMDGGGSGTVAAIDGDIRLTQKHYLQWSLAATHTSEPDDTALTSGLNDLHFDNGRHTAGFDGESFWGHAVYLGTGRMARHEVIDLSYYERSPRFRADNGFEPENNQRKIQFYAGYNLYPMGQIVHSLRPYLRAGRVWNFDKLIKEDYLSLEMDAHLTAQTNIHPAIFVNRENFRGVQFDNIWLFHLCGHSNFSRPLGISSAVNYGHQIARRESPPVLGKEFSFYLGGYIKPSKRLLIEPSFNYTRSNHIDTDNLLYETYTLRTHMRYQFNRELSFRLITQYNDFYRNWEIDPLITYQLNPFTLLYAGSTHDLHDYDDYDNTGLKQTSRQFFFKIQYLIQM